MKKLKNVIIAIAIMLVFSAFILFSMTNEAGEKMQYLQHLDYNVKMNYDGSMRVTETWDIDIVNTNTLFKTFTLSKSKFGNITDVEVIDLEIGKKFENIYQEMYHVPEGQFYALNLNSRDFEIAFGVGMDEKKGNRKFQISYTVEDVVTEYKDCQEIYWQFLEEGQNAIPAKKVTGTITLPENVSNIEDLRVWGHGQLNGQIYRKSASQVEFVLNNLNPKSRLEIRVVSNDKMFYTSYNKMRNYSYLNTILNEENRWSEEANQSSKDLNTKMLIALAVYIVILGIRIMQTVKLAKKNKSESVDKNIKLKYFRDIPREATATPAEATYLYQFDKTRLDTGKVQSKAVASTILNLCYKKKISLRPEANNKVYIKIISDESGLKEDELEIYTLLEKVADDKEEFEISELNKYAKKNYSQYSVAIDKFVNSARNSLYELNLIDKKQESLYTKYGNADGKRGLLKYISMFMFIFEISAFIPVFKTKLMYVGAFDLFEGLLVISIVLLPLTLVSMHYWTLQGRMKNKIAVLTDEGKQEKAEWIGLANFMKDYSLLNEKDILSLAVWEKYLIYATAFGISDKVIEQMKAKYPEVFIKEKWDDDKMLQEYPILHFALNPVYYIDSSSNYSSLSALGKDVSRAYSTSMSEIAAHSSSSGSGGGGGFSGGGGGRWRSVAGMGGR